MLKERLLVFQIITLCTLKCKLCVSCSPIYKKRNIRYIAPVEQVKREMDAVFQIYDFIEDITITGGEPLLHNRLTEICEYILKYQSQYNQCRIFTNGTIMPAQELIDLLVSSKEKLKIVVDHYGDELSIRTWDIKKKLEDNGLEVRVNMYCGDDPYCGGWVDLGDLSEQKKRSQEYLEELVKDCHNATWKDLSVFKGRLHLCACSAFGSDLGFFVPKHDEYVDLFDTATSLEEKKEMASTLGSRPLTACGHCDGFNVEKSVRFKPAEQLEE